MDVGGVRYFDLRELDSLYFPILKYDLKALPSDSLRRKDAMTLRMKDVEGA